ncbi:MAG: UbiD family decarboxylase, partial [Desulfomonile tiedjei]|nr:UbiD family decarboxylase [Desulfomonile tiedjei]
MSFQDMGEFISYLEQTDQLVRITVPVSRDLEITEITDRIVKGPSSGNKALLFENVEGFSMPVVANLFGSESRISAALGVASLNDL